MNPFRDSGQSVASIVSHFSERYYEKSATGDQPACGTQFDEVNSPGTISFIPLPHRSRLPLWS